MIRSALRLAAIVLLPVLSGAGEAAAHGGRPFTPDDGIAVSSLTHGQMGVIARHRSAILSLAGRHYPPDDRLRRLANYAALQRTWCLWNLMPGTVSDETSPFNLCAHASLAATRDAFLRLQELRPADPGVLALSRRIEMDMMADSTALILCGFSGDAFSTALLIRPDWRAVPGHWPSLLALMAAGAGVAFGIRLLRGSG